MKRLLALLLCLVMAASVAGCGKDNEKSAETKTGSVQVQSEEKSDETAETDKEEKEDIPSAQTTEITPESAEALSEIVEEFNNTDDPVAKEELRKKLEAIFAQVEAASAKE